MARKFSGALAVAAFSLLALISTAPQGVAQNLAVVESASLPRGDDQLPPAPPGRVLSDADAALYRQIFKLQKSGKWHTADKRIAELTDNLLMGHVLYQRYMHPTAYRSKYAELMGWMADYADHPGAKRVYRLALERRPKNWRWPRKPQGAAFGQQSNVRAKAVGNGQRVGRSPGRKARRLMRQVKWRVRRGRPTQALKLIDTKVNRRIMGSAHFDRALTVIARGYFHAGMDEKALETATRAIDRSGAEVLYANWWAGLAAWRLDRHRLAAVHFATMANAPEVSDWPRAAAAFWSARASLVGQVPASVTPMLRVAGNYPYTFYGMLALQALDELAPFDWKLPTLGEVEIRLLQGIPAAKRALALIEAGQSLIAETELKGLTGAPSPELSRVLLALVGNANLPDIALRLGQYLARNRGERYDAALFPVPDWTPSKGYTIDKALVFAFIRQESRFKTMAKCRSGATGLMQLMPATARFIANRRERRQGRRALYEPELNLTLGQKYIRHLLDNSTIGGNLFYAVAAYNAGPGNLRKWRRRIDYRDDPLLFIESIPSRETRDYVERVLTNFWTYRRRFNQSTPSLAAIAAGAWPVYIPMDVSRKTANVN